MKNLIMASVLVLLSVVFLGVANISAQHEETAKGVAGGGVSHTRPPATQFAGTSSATRRRNLETKDRLNSVTPRDLRLSRDAAEPSYGWGPYLGKIKGRMDARLASIVFFADPA